ncbi:hypothetical protein MGA3_08175 [Bacillus methanolicus MGA3]|nr:hypothetical protein MGA3_08175 [Bacillus methanolicus MGA3]
MSHFIRDILFSFVKSLIFWEIIKKRTLKPKKTKIVRKKTLTGIMYSDIVTNGKGKTENKGTLGG